MSMSNDQYGRFFYEHSNELGCEAVPLYMRIGEFTTRRHAMPVEHNQSKPGKQGDLMAAVEPRTTHLWTDAEVQVLIDKYLNRKDLSRNGNGKKIITAIAERMGLRYGQVISKIGQLQRRRERKEAE